MINNIDFQKEYLKYKDEIIKNTMELVSIPSVLVENEEVDGVIYPFGINNKLALDKFLSLAKEMGFKTKNVENVCGHVEYGKGEEIFAVLCHLDVVPADGDWKNPPFSPWIEDGKIFGRGTGDDKGPAVCSLYALKVLKDLGFEPKRRIRLIVGTDEESGSRGLKRYLQVEENPTLGISPDADFPIIYGEKGIASLEITGENKSNIEAYGGVRLNVVAPWAKFKCDGCEDCLEKPNFKKEGDYYFIEGKSAHAMEPKNGVNAIKEFVSYIHNKTDDSFINFIYDKLMDTRLNCMGLNTTDDEMGDLTMNIGILEMTNISKLAINLRYPKNLDFDAFFEEFSKQAGEYGLKVKCLGNTKVHYVNPKSEFIQTLYASYKKYAKEAKLMTIGGGTYAREIKNGVAFGVKFPGEVEMAHEVNEYISIDSLLKAGVIITDAIYSVNKE